MPITIPGSCEPGICVFGKPVPAGGRLSGGARAAAGSGRWRGPAPASADKDPRGEFHVKSIFFHFTWDFFRSVKKLQETPMSNQIELCHNESSRVEEKRLNCRLTRFE